GIQTIPADFRPSQILEASACVVAPGLIDLAARLREPGHEHARMLESEMAAAVAGGVTRLVCPPDTDPVLDEPGLVEMLRFRSEKLNLARLHPLGALTRKLAGDTLTDMVELSEAGCVAFSQAELPLANTLVMQRAFQYASTFDFAVWLRAQDFYLGRGVAASGALATRMGLSGVPVAAETIALHTIFELMRATGVRVHLCRLSSAAGVALVREAKREGLRLSCDVSINSLHLIDGDIGYFDSRARLNPPLRQQRDREALQAGLADGTIDALVSDHTPVDEDAKALPFAESEAGATGLELLLSLSLKWGAQRGLSLAQSLAPICSGPAKVIGPSLGAQSGGVGRVQVGALADLCVFDPAAAWTVGADSLRSQGKHTPFSGYELPGRVRYTLVGGRLAFRAT
ncbi:MAG: dihydroorotase, partial [Betaproteobacteria bacterium]|nr:dihydroorotase [Betaproteobacteria bacterium]